MVGGACLSRDVNLLMLCEIMSVAGEIVSTANPVTMICCEEQIADVNVIAPEHHHQLPYTSLWAELPSTPSNF